MKNLDACMTGLCRLPSRARGALLSARRAAAGAALREAKAIAPQRTGRLRASISCREKNGTFVLSAKAPYAALVERGTRRQSARPFLLPVARRSGYVQRAADELRKAVKP